MVTTPQFLPPDINVELLLSYYSEGDCRVALKGLHKRNTYGDIIDVEDKSGFMDVTVGRLSLYNSLPEFMFHPTDRFDNLPKYEEKERFQKEIDKQDEEIENAFCPWDGYSLFEYVFGAHRGKCRGLKYRYRVICGSI